MFQRRRHRAPLAEIGKVPDPRISFANERTFLAWIRTSLSLIVAGLAVIHLLPSFEIPYGRRVIGLPLIIIGILIGVTAFDRWERNERALRLDVALPRSRMLPVLSYGIAGVGLLSIALTWFAGD